MKKIDNFVNLYPVTKTLRFKLIPIGKTKENFDKNNLLQVDKDRADNYQKAKIIIDKYYNTFINNCLNNFKFRDKPNNLKEYYLVKNEDLDEEEKNKKIKEIQKDLRDEIVSSFKDNEKKKENFDKLFNSKLFDEILLDSSITSEEKEVINKFYRFNTYFAGFFQNRKNIFSDEDKVGSISYRLINENLKIFINNIKVYEKVSEVLNKDIEKLQNEYKDILKDFRVKDMFDIDYYNFCLTGEDINKYNKMISGDTKIQGLNQYINLYNQKNKEGKRLSKFVPLYKQILSEDKTQNFRFDIIENDGQVYDLIDKMLINIENKNTLEIVKDTFCLLINDKYDNNKIYLSSNKFKDLSVKCFDDYNVINLGISMAYDEQNKNSKKKKNYDDDKDKYMRNISLESIINYVENIEYDKERIVKVISDEINEIVNSVDNAIQEYKKIDKNISIKSDNVIVEKIKNLLDSLLNLYRYKELFCKYDETKEIDLDFYGEISEIDFLDDIVSIYNKIRNYITKKPYKLDKIKLNFNKPNLLNGWVDSKTEKSDNGTQYSGYLFRRKNSINEYDYYLGISEDVKLFRNEMNVNKDDKSDYERLDYYQIKADTVYGQSFTDKNEVKRFNNLKKVLLNNSRINEKWKEKIEKSKELEELKVIADNIIKEKQFNYYNVSKNEIETVLNRQEKPLYLFKICNKDLSYSDNKNIRKARGIDNLHTMYFKALMSTDQNVYDLGKGEIFFREANVKDKNYIVHVANEAIDNKNPFTIVNKKQSKFNYDIIKNKRYYNDQFLFHLSLTINYKKEDIKNKTFN